jgi:PAS domain S-box-containing protein
VKQTSDGVIDSHGVLLSVLALTDDGVVVCDTQRVVVEMNEVATTMLGWGDGDPALGRPIEAVLDHANPGDARGRRIGGDALVQAAGKSPLGIRARLRPARRRDQRSVRISMAASGGGAVFLLRDLSALIAAEDAAHQYKRTADVAIDAIYLAEPESLRILYANEGAARQTGWPREALTGRFLDTLLPLLDLDSIRDAVDGHRAALPYPSTIPTVLRGRDGDLRPVDVLIQPLALDDDPAQLLTVVRDATERVESQAKLQRTVQQERARTAELEATLAAIGDAVIVCDADGTVTLANPATHDVLAHAKIRTYADLLGVLEDPDELAPKLGAPDRQGPIELRLKGRSDRWLELSAFPVVGPTDANPAGTIFLVRDVTAARVTRRMREAFMGILSHELRTPVTTILAGSKVLGRRHHLPESTRDELIQDIEAEAERLYRLVEDLLVLARFEEHRPDAVATEPLLLQRILPTLLGSEEARWPGRRFVLAVPTGLPTVSGDRTYVDQVVRNLLGNAAKYSPADEAIEVVVDEAETRLNVRILDRGPGFAEDEAERLFELYYRSPGTLGIAAGAGIGLFVCRRLIEAMGGEIWARPRDGGGAEFGFALHVLDEEDA